MRTPISSLVIVCVAVTNLSGCALFGLKQQQDARAAQEQQVAEMQARAAEQKAEADRQVAIAEERTAYLTEQLDAQVYETECEALAPDIEKAIVKMGRSVREDSGDMMVTDWSHVQAKYESTYDYRIRQTRKASRSRYVVELEQSDDGCKVEATFQYADESGVEHADRALDLEARVLQEVEPNKYAEIEAEYVAIEQRHPKAN